MGHTGWGIHFQENIFKIQMQFLTVHAKRCFKNRSVIVTDSFFCKTNLAILAHLCILKH